MKRFAKVIGGTVIGGVVADQAYIDALPVDPMVQWIETDPNTLAGKSTNGGVPLRGNYAGTGYTYDAELDAFIPPCDYHSWVLDTNLFQYMPPVPYPSEGGPYKWDEGTVSWGPLHPNP
jgi:hypothetical protein